MKQKKSKNIFWVFSILAVVFLVLFSFAVGASNVPMMILTFILLVATFGIGFTTKKNIEKTIGYKLYRQ
ncbi:putative membrane protein [Staphylococcus aureus]|nr:putative membrane protein [Staphylococcus aureus]